jgi:hypothetical protein
MGKRFLFGMAFCLMMSAQVANGEPNVRPVERVAVPSAVMVGAHPVHAVLRYDLSSAGGCRTFSDKPPELCLLLALHVIHMSEKLQKAL